MTGSQILWLVLLIGFLVAEAACPIHLVSIWFAVGALVSLIAALLDAALWLQVTLFLAISGVLLLAFLPLAKKFLRSRISPTNIDAVIGSTGRVTAAINNIDSHGQVKLGAMEWTARSTSGADIAEGTLVRVDRIEGVKVFVTPL